MIYDLAIVGSGFGGSLLAMVARRLGLSVLLLERGSHPRFAIGESTSPLMNLLTEELAHTYDLPQLLPLATYGAWKRAYPTLGVGLKRGFTYYGHQPGKAFTRCPNRSDQLAVAASPGDECADTHWVRADVDHFLVREAVALGAEYVDQTPIHTLERLGDDYWQINDFTARFLVDASGPNGFLHRHLGLKNIGFCGYPQTRSLYTHFTGVGPAALTDETEAPYPLDASATHHVFPGGWMWVLPFDNGVTSAGFSVTAQQWDDYALGVGDAATWERFLALFPSVGAQFAKATPTEPWHHSERLAFRTERGAGAGWAMLPSAMGFIDPLFSTGMPLTLLGVQRLAVLLQNNALTDTDLDAYAKTTFYELDWGAEFIGTFYGAFGNFEHFSALTMYYFAAASYAELLRRLNQHDSSFRFLSASDPLFRAGVAWCRANPEASAESVFARVRRDIAHKNVAGLCDLKKQNWYGVDLNDVVNAAEKFGMTQDAMREVIATAAWARC